MATGAEGGNFSDQDKETELYKYINTRHDHDSKQVEGAEVKDFYDRNAACYDDILLKGDCVSHIMGARELAKHMKEAGCPSDAKIGDVGAGTGLVGQQLKEEYGYSNITAMDISPGMLEEAKKKGAYNDFVVCDLNEEHLEKFQNQFDHAISIGCFVLGNLKPVALEMMASFVKPGGFVCISFREKNLASKHLGYKEKLEEMDTKGVWKEISRVIDKYLPMGKEDDLAKGCYIVFKIC